MYELNLSNVKIKRPEHRIVAFKCLLAVADETDDGHRERENHLHML